ncbi:MAG: thioredoxin domain-containing protein [Thermodesulfobacteriota bacterium]
MRKYVFPIFPAVLFFLLQVPAAYAEGGSEGGVQEELQEIKKDISQIKKDISEIKRFLKSRTQAQQQQQRPPAQAAAATEAETGIDDDYVLGDRNAPVTIIEFSDYECPFCSRHFKQTMPQIKKEYIDSGKARYVFRDFPLPFHKQAQKAAEAAQCAGEQGKYWEMHDTIFANQSAMKLDDLRGYGKKLGLESDRYNKCLDSGKYAQEVRDDMAAGQKIGIRGTPSFVIGKTTKSGKIKGKIIRGAQPYPAFKAAIDELLK